MAPPPATITHVCSFPKEISIADPPEKLGERLIRRIVGHGRSWPPSRYIKYENNKNRSLKEVREAAAALLLFLEENRCSSQDASRDAALSRILNSLAYSAIGGKAIRRVSEQLK